MQSAELLSGVGFESRYHFKSTKPFLFSNCSSKMTSQGSYTLHRTFSVGKILLFRKIWKPTKIIYSHKLNFKIHRIRHRWEVACVEDSGPDQQQSARVGRHRPADQLQTLGVYHVRIFELCFEEKIIQWKFS